MAGEILYRAFRTRGVYANMDAFRRVVGEGMQQTVFPKIVKGLEGQIEHWDVDDQFLEFLPVKLISEAGISIKVFPRGPGVKLWKFKSFGTKEHKVRVKKTHTMRHHRFKRYKPALALPNPGVKRGFGPAPFAPGTVGFRHEVVVPAMAGQFFEKRVADDYKANRQFSRDMEKIVRKAVRAAQKEGN